MIIPTGHRPTSEMNQSRRMARITVVIRPRIRGSVRFSGGLIGSRIDDTVPTDPVVITERDVAQFQAFGFRTDGRAEWVGDCAIVR